MPEYLAPGVYIEEVSFRARSIEAVSTSTIGMAGFTRYGPVDHPSGPRDHTPRLVTSFAQFERVYGGREPFASAGQAIDGRIPLLAQAARAFFLNGGQRLYVSRVFTDNGVDDGVATLQVPLASGPAIWRARWPGAFANVSLRLEFVRNRSLSPGQPVTRTQRWSVVEIIPGAPPAAGVAPVPGRLAVVDFDAATGTNVYRTDDAGATVAPRPSDTVQIIELRVLVQPSRQRLDVYPGLGGHPEHHRWVGRVLSLDDPADASGVVWFDGSGMAGPVTGALELVAAAAVPRSTPLDTADDRLAGGNDGALPAPADLLGSGANPDDPDLAATGLEALGEVEDVAIVASPDAAAYATDVERTTATGNLIAYAERERLRIAVLVLHGDLRGAHLH
jgi:uncharacterized protein